jgi:hypothetical protein
MPLKCLYRPFTGLQNVIRQGKRNSVSHTVGSQTFCKIVPEKPIAVAKTALAGARLCMQMAKQIKCRNCAAEA